MPAIIRKSEIVVPRSGSITISAPKASDDDPDRLEQLAERGRRGAPREHRAGPEQHRELRDLGRLDADRAEDEPAVGAVDRRRDREHGDAGDERDDEEERARAAAGRGSRHACSAAAGRAPRRRRAPCLTRKRIGSPSPSAADADVALKTITSPNATSPSVTRISSRCSSCPRSARRLFPTPGASPRGGGTPPRGARSS